MIVKSFIMTKYFFIAVLAFNTLFAQNSDSLIIRNLFTHALTKGKCYSNLQELCFNAGPRISGSKEAEISVEITAKQMREAGADTVILQECMVPHWVRGEKEIAFIVDSKKGKIEVPVCALGSSIATPPEGITAQVIEVKNFEELKNLGLEKVKGKIVFFNRAFDQSKINTFEAYSGAVNQRSRGAIEAAKYGAIGVVVRSMSSIIEDYPHTGNMRYLDSIPKIPACAISTKGAEILSQQIKNGSVKEFYFKQNCQTLPDVKSFNVIGEIKGAEYPNEIIVVGGHLDAWDMAQGAHDDGAGIVHSIELLHLFKSLGIKPKRTIRVVAFMNEENGVRGGNKYAEIAKAKSETHIFALESDEGGFTPRGFALGMSAEKRNKILAYRNLLEPYGITDFSHSGGGTDIEPLELLGVPVSGFIPDPQRYFDVHHSGADTFDKINKRELELGAASIAALVYLIDKYGL